MAIDYEDALGYPIRGDGAVVRFLVGGGLPSALSLAFVGIAVLSFVFPLFGILSLLLYPVGFVIGLLLTGYYVRVVRETYAGEDEPPSFGDWTALVVDGGYCFLIGIAYALPLILVGIVAAVIFAVVVGGGAAMGGNGTESLFAALGVVSLLVVGVLALLAIVYGLAVSYLYPISVCIYADTDGLRESFSRERLLAVGKSEEYAIPWLVQAGVMFGIQTFVGMLTIVLIGYLLYPFLPFATFYVTTAAFYMFATAYDENVGAEETGSDTDGRSAVRKDVQGGGEAGY